MVQSSGCLEGHILGSHVPLKKTLRLGWQMHVELNSATPTLATINFSLWFPQLSRCQAGGFTVTNRELPCRTEYCLTGWVLLRMTKSSNHVFCPDPPVFMLLSIVVKSKWTLPPSVKSAVRLSASDSKFSSTTLSCYYRGFKSINRHAQLPLSPKATNITTTPL